MLAGKPFLWDIYRESNGAHEEKIRDFGEFVDGLVNWGDTLARFTKPDGFDASLETLLNRDERDFSPLAKALRRRSLRDAILEL